LSLVNTTAQPSYESHVVLVPLKIAASSPARSWAR
jgi:hypothetical protein